MYININENEYQLKTTLGVSIQLEKKFRLPLTQIFEKIGTADIDELIDIIRISADKLKDGDFKDDILDNWDYTDLQLTVQELVSRLMFTGNDEEVARKIDKYPLGESQKNAIRRMLGIQEKLLKSPIE